MHFGTVEYVQQAHVEILSACFSHTQNPHTMQLERTSHSILHHTQYE